MGRLIDADELFDAMDFHVTSVSVCATVDEARGMSRMKQICLEDVKNAPTVDAMPVVHARWRITTERFTPELVCTACGVMFPCISDVNVMAKLKYCPNCGAKMDGGEENG